MFTVFDLIQGREDGVAETAVVVVLHVDDCLLALEILGQFDIRRGDLRLETAESASCAVDGLERLDRGFHS